MSVRFGRKENNMHGMCNPIKGFYIFIFEKKERSNDQIGHKNVFICSIKMTQKNMHPYEVRQYQT